VGAGVDDPEEAGVGVGVGDAEEVADGVGDAVPPLPEVQVPGGLVMTLLSKVTAPVSASARPGSIVARVCMATLAYAMIVPTNALSVPIVAELPTIQKTPQPPPLVIETRELLMAVRALTILKMKTALGSPELFKVMVPVSTSSDV
jgi:hypothetical protein